MNFCFLKVSKNSAFAKTKTSTKQQQNKILQRQIKKNSKKNQNKQQIKKNKKTNNKKNNVKNGDNLSNVENINNTNGETRQALSLIHILDLALKNNNSIKMSYINVDMSKYDLDIQKSNRYPNVSFNSSVDINKSKTDGNSSDIFGFNNYIVAKYTIFAFGKVSDKIKEVEYRLNSIKYQNNSDIQNLIYEISVLYYKILSALAQKDALIETEKASFETLQAVNLKYKLGMVVLNDKLKAEANNNKNKLEIIQIDNKISALKTELNQYLNLQPNYDISLNKLDYMEINKNTKNYEELIEIAYQNRNDLLKQIELKNMYNKQLDYAKKHFLPSFDVSARAGRNENKYLNDEKFKTKNSYMSADLSITIPLFNGFADVSQESKVKQQIRQQNLAVEQLKNDIAKEVFDANKTLKMYENTLDISKKILESSKESAKLAFGMYKNGKMTITDLLTTNSDLEKAKFEYIDNRFSWIIAKLNLLKTIGQMTVENVNNILEF